MTFTRSRAKKLLPLLAEFFILTLILSSCSSTKQKNLLDVKSKEITVEKETVTDLNLAFAGDVMAHSVNYRQKDFSKIWQDIKPVLQGQDLAFANIEAPVCDSREWSNYPQFNMHSSYIKAATEVGFNVFSLANNHSNDWYLEGIKETRDFFEKLEKTEGLYACGLRKKNDGKLTYRLIEKNGWKILFTAFTELLNRPDYASYIDYFPQKKHQDLIAQLKKLQQENKPDLFIISVHTDEAEYKKEITKGHRDFYSTLINDCGADIIWANHPHVTKEFEAIEIFDGDKSRKAFVMYANGNTISGQRTRPSLKHPPNERDDTGDGLLIKLRYTKKSAPNSKPVISLEEIEPHLITTYITPDAQFVIRLADEDFVHSLERSGLSLWAEYIKSRIQLYEQLKGNSVWQ